MEEVNYTILKNRMQHASPTFKAEEIVSVEGDTREREGKSISPFSAFISCTTKVFRKHTGWATSVQIFGSPRRIGGIIADIEAHFVHQASRRTWSMHS